MNKFKQKNYFVIKKAISKEFAEFIYNYLILKSNVVDNLFKDKYLEPFNTDLGTFGTNEQVNIPETYCCYGDFVMETLLLKLKGKMEKLTKLQLIPNYSYTRIYKNGDILKRHRDRFSCEISVTMFLGGQQWPIFINSTKEIKVNLKVGDMLLYRGNELDHWRDPFEGKDCAQVFLHYTNAATPGAKKEIFDARPHLGLPKDFKNNKL